MSIRGRVGSSNWGLERRRRRRRRTHSAFTPPPPLLPALCSRNLSQRVAGYSKKLTSEGDALADEVRTGAQTGLAPARDQAAPPRPSRHEALSYLGRRCKLLPWAQV